MHGRAGARLTMYESRTVTRGAAGRTPAARGGGGRGANLRYADRLRAKEDELSKQVIGRKGEAGTGNQGTRLGV